MPDVKIRLLICAQCESIEELPWYEGPQEHDDTGNYRLSQHRYPSGQYHPFTVGDVLEREWKDPELKREINRAIIEQIKRANPDAGLGSQFYDVKNNFQHDAMTCWRKHGQPGGAHKFSCEEWRSDRKRLLPDTRADRRAEGLDTRNRPNTFLCDFCPYATKVMERQRTAEGMYDS